jgi:hypothetical protein
MMGWKGREAAARFAERRKREDEAPRLHTEVPALASLRINVEDRRSGVVGTESKHVRVVVVERAPALFVVPCGDPACDGGGVDLTGPILRDLRAHKTEGTFERSCDGTSGNAPCARVVRATIQATYR